MGKGMKSERMWGLGLILLGTCVAASSLLGPLVLEVIRFRVSASAETQLVGGEIVSLLIVAPMAIAAGLLAIRGHDLAPPLALAPSLYALYLAFSLVLGVDYARYPGNNERFFPLYWAITVLAAYSTLAAWAKLSRQEIPEPGTRLRWTTSGVLILLGVLLGLTWSKSIWDVLSGSNISQEYLGDPNTYWVIRLLDTAFVIPAALAAGMGLLMRRRSATRAVYGLLGFLMCEAGAVAGMAAAMAIRRDPFASVPFLVITAIGTVALAVLAACWLLLYATHTRDVADAEVIRQAA